MSKRDDVSRDFYEPFTRGFRRNSARDRKHQYEAMFTRIFMELSINRFKWSGMPDEIDLRFLELQLTRAGLAVFFYDAEQYDRYFALRASGSGMWNMYDNPIAFTVTGNAMINRTLKATDCVPIWCNALRIPDWDFMTLYATKLAELERTIEINVMGMRTPYLFAVDDNQKMTFANMWRQIQEGEPAIFGTDTLLGQDELEKYIKPFNIGIDKDQVLNLQIVKSKMWNECMTLLGIDNANQDKRERLVADEVAANNEQISAIREMCLKARRQACDLINKKYGLDVSVEWNTDTPLGSPDIPLSASQGGVSTVTDPR